jgi:hypothetical protein
VNSAEINPLVGLPISIVLGLVPFLVGNEVVPKIKPPPVGKAFIIVTVDHLLGKLFYVFRLPAILTYSLPTSAFLILSYYFFKPTIPKLLLYWLVGFATYIVIHISVSSLFDWTFMFPFWKVRLF